MIRTAIVPNLWFDRNAEEAVAFYISVFPNSSIDGVLRGTPEDPNAAVAIEYTLDGNRFVAINGGPHFTLSEAVSFAIETEDQAQTDHYWDVLTADGGEESQCGWLKDRFGLSWQVYPRELMDLLNDPDPARATAATQQIYQQSKIDIAAIRAAADAATK